MATLCLLISCVCAGGADSQDHQATIWSLAPTPNMVVGATNGAPGEELYLVRAALRLSTGSILVANAGSRNFSLFDSEGNLFAVFGGSGRGPREFQDISAVDVVGDTIVVWDHVQNRISLWDSTGSYVGGYALPVFRGAPTAFLSAWTTSLLLVRSRDIRVGTAALSDTHSVLLRFDAKSRTLRQIEEVFWRQTLVYVEGLNRTTYRVPFAPAGLAQAYGSGLVYADTRHPTVAVYDSVGLAEYQVTLPIKERHTQERAYNEYVGQLLEVASGRSRTRIRNAFDRYPTDSPAPALRSLKISPNGTIWIEERPVVGADVVRWHVVDGGKPTGYLDVPTDLEVMAISELGLVALHRDALGVEQVMVFAIRK